MQLQRFPQQGGNNIALPVLPAANFAAPWTGIIPLDRDRYLFGIELGLRFRLTTAVAAGAALNAEAPQNIIRRVRVTMNHEVFKNKIIRNISGASLYARANIFNQVAPSATGGIAVGNAGYDIEIHYPIPFVVEGIIESQRIPTILDAPRCSSLQLEIDFATGADLVQAGAGTTYAFSAFGSGTGNPELTVTKLVPLGFNRAPHVALSIIDDTIVDIHAAASDRQRIGNELPTGDTIARIWLKQFVQDTNQAGFEVAATMTDPTLSTDAGLTSVILKRNGTAIREWQRWRDLRNQNQVNKRLISWPAGYTIIDFTESGSLNDALYTQDYPASKTRLELYGLINALANNQLTIMRDTVLANPNL